MNARIRKLAKSFLDTEAVEAGDGSEDDDYDSDVAESQLLIRRPKKKRTAIISESEEELVDEETAPVKKKKVAKKQPKEVQLDFSSGVKAIPCFDAKLDGTWRLKLQDFKGEKWISLRKFDGEAPGPGATLPFSYLGSVVKAFNALARLVQNQSKND